MTEGIANDLRDVVKALSRYVETGFVVQRTEYGFESTLIGKPESSRVKPLEKLRSCNAKFVGVDCSTRTLKRANNWAVYLLRVAYAIVEKREVDWGYTEKIRALIGTAYTRHRTLRNLRFKIESETALNLTEKLSSGDYILLDGASYFGEKTGFHVSLYEGCRRKGINLLAISKQSPTLHDANGRDFQATVQLIASYPIWVYHPVVKANLKKHLYGDVSIIKLCEGCARTFRCDVMAYVTDHEIAEILSPLTSISEDPRCLGYPIPLWLAHEFSGTSDSKLLYHYEQVESLLKEAGFYDRLRREELACSFADELHGVRYPFEREWIGYI